MNCPECNNSNLDTFGVEPVECVHCEKTTYVEFRRCVDCGATFKTVGDKVIEGSITSISDDLLSIVADLVNATEFSELKNLDEQELKDLINEMGDELVVKEYKIGSLGGMQGVLHRCLNCNSIAYESGPGVYTCAKCGFEWEVVDCG